MGIHQNRISAGHADFDVFLRKAKLISRSHEYVNLESPVHLLDSWLTPVELFFVRNHLPQPRIGLAQWRLVVTGEVKRPFELTFADLKKIASNSVVNTMEGAGNGRALYDTHAPGVQWVRGAVGTAEVAGPRLADVLRRAGVKPSAKHVALNGLDAAHGDVQDFIRSIPIEKAMDPDTLLATHMNGEPLTIEHGFPVRALVPGWVGAASVKWLTEIRVLDREFDGPFMNPGYRYPTRPSLPGEQLDPRDAAPMTTLPVKSLIWRPTDGACCGRGSILVQGAAWSGEAEISKVEVSTDDGHTWQQALLGEDRSRYAWRLWEYIWNPAATGSYTILSRATDCAGRTQPLQAMCNPSGFLWNSIDRVRIHVER
jgi:sulfite oxidase